MLVNLNKLLKKARANKFAIGAFNVNSFVYADAFIKAAEEKCSPVILQFSPGVLKTYQDSFLVEAIAHVANMSSVPIVMHLDHGKTIDDIKLALQYDRFTSYMIDGSALKIDDNIELVNNVRQKLDEQYKKTLKKTNSSEGNSNYLFSLEAEIGHVGNNDDHDSIETSLNSISNFLECTDIDSLAISIGNVHGQNERKTELNIDLLKKINTKFFDIPFVLHGSSGVKHEDLKKAIKYGITKINVNTHFKTVLEDIMAESYEKYGKSFFSNYKLVQPLLFNALKEEAMKLIDLFGSNNSIVPSKLPDNLYRDAYYAENQFEENTYYDDTAEDY
jgi:ketose-bisphosphate aldolase